MFVGNHATVANDQRSSSWALCAFRGAEFHFVIGVEAGGNENQRAAGQGSAVLGLSHKSLHTNCLLAVLYASSSGSPERLANGRRSTVVRGSRLQHCSLGVVLCGVLMLVLFSVLRTQNAHILTREKRTGRVVNQETQKVV